VISKVYSRKWRPQRFSDLAGQEHVVTTLCQAVVHGRVSHAYLFCGPRGTGKTTTARILANAVNCRHPVDGDPCNACEVCQVITEGRFLDIIELDAASYRGIDEIRNIRDKVAFAPMEGGRKVYIIDEAHMLTEHASNAFLKTLEEPPDHAIFILCTTEPHKLPSTVVSRCQRFDFRRLLSSVITERLRMICHEENVQVEENALYVIARFAGGSLRDAENLLEQLVVSNGSSVGMEAVRDLLGRGHMEQALEIVGYLLLGNAASALGSINRAAWEGTDLRQLHRESIQLIRGVLVQQWGVGDSLDLPPEVLSELGMLASRVSPERVAMSLRMFSEVDMRQDAPSTLPLELAVVEACLGGPSSPNLALSPQVQMQPIIQPLTPIVPEVTAVSTPVTDDAAQLLSSHDGIESDASGTPKEDAGEGISATIPPSPVYNDRWGELLRALSRVKVRRFNVGALLRDCKEHRVDGDSLILTFAHRSHLERMEQELQDPQSQKSVRQALEKYLGAPYKLSLVLAGGNGGSDSFSPTKSPLVRYALGMGAKVLEEQDE
jgi:DNA polymerase-3 subunit gamma/tau